MAQATSPLVGIIMGSKSDWEHMSAAAEALSEFKVSHEVRILSAHRTPDLTLEYAASAMERGLQVMIAGAGGAAHLPGVASVSPKSARTTAAQSSLVLVLPTAPPIATHVSGCVARARRK